MSRTLNKAATALLAEIVAATAATGNGFVVLKSPATKALLEDPALIEVNESVTNEAGEVGARATEAGKSFGVEAQGQDQGNAAVAKPAKSKPSFKIESGVALPAKNTVSTRSERYPFSVLEIGQSFFVADSDVTSGNAYATLSSTVATYNQKFSEETGQFRPHRRDANKQVAVRRPLRHFELRKLEEDGVTGARVYRTELPQGGDVQGEGEE